MRRRGFVAAMLGAPLAALFKPKAENINVIEFHSVSPAVNHNPILTTAGSDVNVDLKLLPKSSGQAFLRCDGTWSDS